MNLARRVNRRPDPIAVVFLVLMLALAILTSLDWLLILEPRLRAEAETTARALTDANARSIEQIKTLDGNKLDINTIRGAVSEMLILTDAQTNKPFFVGVDLEFAPPWEKDSFHMGESKCAPCFTNSVPLFQTGSGKLIGNLTVHASPVFYQAMRDDTRNSFLIWTTGLLALMSLGWWALSLHQKYSAQSDIRASAIFDASPIPLLLVGEPDGTVKDANEAAETLFATTSLSGLNMNELLEPTAFSQLASATRHGSLSLETTLKLPEGRLPVIATATPVDIDERLSLIIGIIDVSEHKAFEKRIEAEKEKSESASRAKSDFLAAMSHEIRTPLNGILGFTHVLNKTSLADDQREHLELINISARNLLSIIEEILDFSRIEAGKFQVRESDVDLPNLLADTVRLFRVKAEEKRLELLYREANDLPQWIYTDDLRVRQLIGILLDNAIKFTPRGGLELQTTSITDVNESYLILRVSDSGIGIPKDELPKLFEPFYQVDQSSRRPFGGTGLGLVIARNICESLGGNIEVDSNEGHGSCFTVKLPLRLGNKKMPENNTALSAPLGTRIPDVRALVVDDDPINGKLLVYLLQARNVIADRAESGGRAIQMMADRQYNIVFLDLHMPGISGWDVVKELQRKQGSGERNYPPIIATTADVQKDSRERLLNDGMDDFLAKPVNPDTLNQLIARWTQTKAHQAN